jgi:hypothetical protein
MSPASRGEPIRRPGGPIRRRARLLGLGDATSYSGVQVPGGVGATLYGAPGLIAGSPVFQGSLPLFSTSGRCRLVDDVDDVPDHAAQPSWSAP